MDARGAPNEESVATELGACKVFAVADVTTMLELSRGEKTVEAEKTVSEVEEPMKMELAGTFDISVELLVDETDLVEVEARGAEP